MQQDAIFTRPPKLRELGDACGQGYHTIWRLCRAGILQVVHFPDGDRVATEAANRYATSGLTVDELRRYREVMREGREKRGAAAQ